jgi:hypothetical protein
MDHILSGWTCQCGWTGPAEQRAWCKGMCCCPRCGSHIQHYAMSRETANQLAATPRNPETIYGIPVEWPEDHS